MPSNSKKNWKELEKEKVAFESKTLVLQRIQLADALRKKVKQNDSQARPIMETMKDIITLSSNIVQSHLQGRVIRENLNEIRRKRLLLKQAEEQKLQQVVTTMRKKKEEVRGKAGEKLELIHKSIQNERKMTILIQNILQSIVTGCQVNWAKDPSLREIILQLEKDVSVRNPF